MKGWGGVGETSEEWLQRSHDVVFLGEDTEYTERGFCGLGTFSGHLEAATGEDPDRPPRVAGVSIEQALQWARAHASRIVVNYCSPEGEPSFYSAGAEPVQMRFVADGPLVDLPLWPPANLSLAPGRNPGWEFTDRTQADRPISWDVFMILSVSIDPRPDATAISARLTNDPELGDLEWRAIGRGSQVMRACVRTHASTREQAECTVMTKAQAAVRAACPEIGPPRIPFWYWELTAYPTGSSAARWNIHVHDEP
jgi:hypothetical protein